MAPCESSRQPARGRGSPDETNSLTRGSRAEGRGTLGSKFMVIPLAGFDGKRQPVSRRRKGAGGERGESTRRVVGPIEIQYRPAVHGEFGDKEPAGGIRRRLVRGIGEQEPQLSFVGGDGSERGRAVAEVKMRCPQERLVRNVPGDAGNRDRGPIARGFEGGFDDTVRIRRIPGSFLDGGRQAAIVPNTQAKTPTAFNDHHREVAEAQESRILGGVGAKGVR